MILSLAKSIRECRYKNPEVQKYLFRQTMILVNSGVQKYDEPFLSYMYKFFAYTGDKEMCAEISSKTNYEQLQVPQNILNFLSGMSDLQEYDHAKFRMLLKKLLEMEQENIRKQNRQNQNIFNYSLNMILHDYIQFGCDDDLKAKHFA